MHTVPTQSRVAWFVRTIVILLLIAPVLAGGTPDAQQPRAQDSRSPFLPSAVPERADQRSRRPVNLTFTKWITGFPLMAGFVGGDVAGAFVGEVLQYQQSLDGQITRLEAMYEVQAGNQSFTALVRGGQHNQAGAAILDGVILGGWRTGELVHVEYEVKSDCPGAPAGTCFQGTITLSARPETD